MVRYVGLDVHKRTLEACFIDAEGKVVVRASCECTRDDLLLFARNHLRKEDHLALEATTNTWAVVAILEPFVAEIVVSNPLKTKAIAEAKVKTDKVDAFVLAQLLRTDFLPRIWIPDKDTRELRARMSRRSSLVQDKTGIKCHIHSTLHQRLIKPPVDEIFGLRGRSWLKTLELDPDGRAAIDADLRLLVANEKEIAALDEEIARAAYADDRLKLLATLPGLGVNVGMTLLAAWGDHTRFPSAAKAVSYLGLVPITHQSADKCYHGHITKQGNSDARWMLIQAAQHLAQDPGPLGHFYRKLRKRKCHNIAVVAAARKLATIAWLMLKNKEPYRYAQPMTAKNKLQKLRVQATGVRGKTGPRKGGERPKRTFGPGIWTREVPSLSDVLQSEGLPPNKPLQELPPGETSFLEREKLVEHVRSINVTKRVARKRSQTATSEEKAGAIGEEKNKA